MGKKKSYITFTDGFCGCGGSSLAVKKLSERTGGGLHVKYGLNHWALAIETHNTNFPDTEHDCADISSTNPRRYNSTDFCLMSPECTKQGDAIGIKKPTRQTNIFDERLPDAAHEKSRATMWDVPRFAEVHQYNYIIVENVWQARKWIQFDNWLRTMHTLGYQHKIVYFNSMFAYPTPQSRDRMYVHFWKKNNKAPDLNFYPKAFCIKCDKDVLSVQSWKQTSSKAGIYGDRGQYQYCCPNCTAVIKPYYSPALNAIDFTDLGTKIGEKKRPLAKNSLKRIIHGWGKFGRLPLYIQAEHSRNMQNINSFDSVFPTQATRQTIGFAFPENIMQFLSYYYGGSNVSSHILSPVNTLTTVEGIALVSSTSKQINDWYYRMIKASEGKKIMAFDDWYVIKGDSKEQFIQLGNAVTPPAMEWQIERGLQTFN